MQLLLAGIALLITVMDICIRKSRGLDPAWWNWVTLVLIIAVALMDMQETAGA